MKVLGLRVWDLGFRVYGSELKVHSEVSGEVEIGARGPCHTY